MADFQSGGLYVSVCLRRSVGRPEGLVVYVCQRVSGAQKGNRPEGLVVYVCQGVSDTQ